MRVDEKFNLKSARLVECDQPVVESGVGLALGLRIRLTDRADGRGLNIHLTPEQALKLANDLIQEATAATEL